MSTKQPYTYVVLRYIHDVMTGEFVNVGIVLAAPSERKFFAKTRKTIGRIKHVFPDLERDSFVEAMRSIDRGVRLVRKQVTSEGFFAAQKDAASYARMVAPIDDSSLQWSPVAAGLSDDLVATTERLYERFVSRYDISAHRRKSDDDVWRPVREMLSNRGVELHLETKKVAGKTDTIEFRRAWKNGSWHAYEPISFDLADADGIKDKARKWRGHLAAVSEGVSEDIQLHFLLGRPANQSLLNAYDNAVEILKGAPFNPVIFEESDVNVFVDSIEDKVREHEIETSFRT